MLHPIAKNALLIGSLLAGLHGTAAADAVLRSSDPDYPMRLMRHTVTDVTVDIDGLVAETRAYAEFRNDWDRPTDAVYSFPVPENAFVSRMWYSQGDSIFEAVLKEVPQSTVPGTGEGGFAAELNAYLGKGKVSLHLKGIPPGAVQRVELRYLQKLDVENGILRYRFPLATGDFLPQALDQLGIAVNVRHSWPLEGWASPSHSTGWRTLHEDGNRLSVRLDRPKEFLGRDFLLSLTPSYTDVVADVVSYRRGDSAGYMLASALPPAYSGTADRTVLFLVDKSRSMTGFKLEQSVAAIKACLRTLRPQDRFSLQSFDYSVKVLAAFQAADSTAKLGAEAQLDSLVESVGYGSTSLPSSLNEALASFPPGGQEKELFLFSDGFSPFKPEDIRNDQGIPVFTVGLGGAVTRARLAALSAANAGLSLFLGESDEIQIKTASFFSAVARPILKSAALTAPSGRIFDALPYPVSANLYAWDGLALVGRYSQAGAVDFTLKGAAPSGPVTKTVAASFAADSGDGSSFFVARYWAAEKIRSLEWRIEIYGPNDSLRHAAVALSLAYKVKSRYTSYWADYESLPSDPTPDHGGPISIVALSASPQAKGLSAERQAGGAWLLHLEMPAATGDSWVSVEIYDAHGRLVRVLARRAFPAGRHTLVWDGRSASGAPLSGVCLLVMRSGGKLSTMRMAL